MSTVDRIDDWFGGLTAQVVAVLVIALVNLYIATQDAQTALIIVALLLPAIAWYLGRAYGKEQTLQRVR